MIAYKISVSVCQTCMHDFNHFKNHFNEYFEFHMIDQETIKIFSDQ